MSSSDESDDASDGEEMGGGGSNADGADPSPSMNGQQQQQRHICPICAADIHVKAGASQAETLLALNAHVDGCLAQMGGC